MGKRLCGNKSLSSKENREELLSIVSEPKHFCSKCLRVASKKGYLCKPEKLLLKAEVPCCKDTPEEESETVTTPTITIHSCEEAPKIKKLKKSKKKKKKLKKEAQLIDLMFRMVE